MNDRYSALQGEYANEFEDLELEALDEFEDSETYQDSEFEDLEETNEGLVEASPDAHQWRPDATFNPISAKTHGNNRIVVERASFYPNAKFNLESKRNLDDFEDFEDLEEFEDFEDLEEFEDSEDLEEFEDLEDFETEASRIPSRPAGTVSQQLCEVLEDFDFDKDTIKPSHQNQLITIARRIISGSQKSAQPVRSVKIIGHTDPVGDAGYNLDLGRRRAKKVESNLRQILDRIRPGSSRGITFSTESRGEAESTGLSPVKARRVVVCFQQPCRHKGCPPFKSRVRLHIKVLVRPRRFSIATMVQSMRQVYGPAGFRVEVASRENLKLPHLEDLDIRCPKSTSVCCPFPCPTSNLNAEHVALFKNRNKVGVNELAVYFVRGTTPTFNGCCAHPTGRPGVVVTANASRWTLAHEVAHVLGLSHVNNNDRLMTGNGTNNIKNPPPDLVRSEIQTMERSSITIPC
ncbi:OmpA family protein [Nitrosospira briensis]|uniref:OmpA family protein n=1 Tax=Nitrosospira briensis TaxID=35799 RepID=A0A1I5DH61_9PROT|nr:OmpA family protein [Nitrosospira briensis]SFN98467.1 OmpA family protein [Nitrosospira briensis]